MFLSACQIGNFDTLISTAYEGKLHLANFSLTMNIGLELKNMS